MDSTKPSGTVTELAKSASALITSIKKSLSPADVHCFSDEGKTNYSDLVQEFPTSANIHYAYGRFLLAFDELDEGIVQFQQEIKNNPAHIRARMRIAAADYRINSPPDYLTRKRL